MKRAVVVMVALGAALAALAADIEPGFFEKLTSAPRQVSQRLANWIATPKEGCDKPEIQSSINADYASSPKAGTA